MKHAIIVGAAGIVVSAAMLGAGFLIGNRDVATPAHAATQPSMASGDQEAVEQIVRNYLLNNPEIMLEVQSALETKQREQQRVAQTTTISDAADEIFHSPHDGVLGNPDGDTTIVEFFDYNCHYCQQALNDMQAMLDKDPELRFVLKEFPILGPDSQKASVVSMAFKKLMPEKYREFHVKLLGSPGRANEASAIKVALSLGADEDALREAMDDAQIAKTVNSTYELAKKLEINGTPSYVVGDEVVFGAIGANVLTQKVEEARVACADGGC